MSYILDALRKADAERERDPARGIHAQPAGHVPVRAARGPAIRALPVACACAALVAGYFAWGRDEPPAVAAVAPAAPVVSAPAAVPAATPVATAAAPAVVTVATTVSPPPPAPVERMVAKAVAAPRPATTLAAAKPVEAGAAPAPRAIAAAVPVAVATLKAPPAAVAPPAAASTAAPAQDRILAIAELPPDVQRDLPKLAISGGVHSDNPAQRMLIVGGQVMTEGQEVAAGVVLEQIRPRSAVLRFRGLRYSVVY